MRLSHPSLLGGVSGRALSHQQQKILAFPNPPSLTDLSVLPMYFCVCVLISDMYTQNSLRFVLLRNLIQIPEMAPGLRLQGPRCREEFCVRFHVVQLPLFRVSRYLIVSAGLLAMLFSTACGVSNSSFSLRPTPPTVAD